MTEHECLLTIKAYDREALLRLWEAIKERQTEQIGWLPGKAFELLILRAFELEGASVTWPFTVRMFAQTVEQIDGLVYLTDDNLYVMLESKDYSKAINIEPIVKLKSQLQRRPYGVFGSIFSVNGFTEPAITLALFAPPQNVLLWHPEDVDYCLMRGMFTDGLLQKYRHCVEQGSPSFRLDISL